MKTPAPFFFFFLLLGVSLKLYVFVMFCAVWWVSGASQQEGPEGIPMHAGIYELSLLWPWIRINWHKKKTDIQDCSAIVNLQFNPLFYCELHTYTDVFTCSGRLHLCSGWRWVQLCWEWHKDTTNGAAKWKNCRLYPVLCTKKRKSVKLSTTAEVLVRNKLSLGLKVYYVHP